MHGGIPISVEPKPGYYDGAYSYLDDEDNYVTSTKGLKVDIHCVDMYDFIDNNTNKRTKWSEVQEKFKFDLGPDPYKRGEEVLKSAKKLYDDIIKDEKSIYNDALIEVC